MNKARAKGTAHENAWVGLLKRGGFMYAERRALAGSLDKGDTVGVPRWAFECKATREFRLSEFMKEAEVERVNAHADYTAVVLKIPRKSIDDCAVIMRAADFVALLAELEKS